MKDVLVYVESDESKSRQGMVLPYRLVYYNIWIRIVPAIIHGR